MCWGVAYPETGARITNWPPLRLRGTPGAARSADGARRRAPGGPASLSLSPSLSLSVKL